MSKPKKGKWNGPPGSDVRGFKLHPQNINRNGRPRKAFSSFNKELEKAGVEKVGREAFRETMQYFINLTEEELESMAEDELQPQAMRIMASELLNPKTRSKYLAEMREWALGTAVQKTEHSGEVTFKDKPLKTRFKDEGDNTSE